MPNCWAQLYSNEGQGLCIFHRWMELWGTEHIYQTPISATFSSLQACNCSRPFEISSWRLRRRHMVRRERRRVRSKQTAADFLLSEQVQMESTDCFLHFLNWMLRESSGMIFKEIMFKDVKLSCLKKLFADLNDVSVVWMLCKFSELTCGNMFHVGQIVFCMKLVTSC